MAEFSQNVFVGFLPHIGRYRNKLYVKVDVKVTKVGSNLTKMTQNLKFDHRLKISYWNCSLRLTDHFKL